MSELKRILILSADAGFGHRSAANAIAEALQETHGRECAIDVVNPLEDVGAPMLLRESQSDYDKLATEAPKVYRFSYEASDSAVPTAIVEGALTVMLFQTMRNLVRRIQPHAIVTTYPLYQAPLGAVSALGQRDIPLLTVVTDLATVHRLWFHDAADLCLVPTQTVRDLAIGYGVPAERVEITGIPVNPRVARRADTREALRARLGWQPDLTTVLAVGSRRVRDLPDFLHVLNHSGLPIQLVVVAGGDDKTYQQLVNTEWHHPTQVYNFVTNMPELMQASDCLISKAGGLITTEALACGLPLLLIDVIPGQETGNAQFVIDGGAGALAETPVDELEILFHWLDHGGELLRLRAHNAQRLGRPRAAYAVADLAWQGALQGTSPKRREASLRALPRLRELLARNGISWQ
jgi:1,2-diacylglycerol 3-beta-galactosyltransferase